MNALKARSSLDHHEYIDVYKGWRHAAAKTHHVDQHSHMLATQMAFHFWPARRVLKSIIRREHFVPKLFKRVPKLTRVERYMILFSAVQLGFFIQTMLFRADCMMVPAPIVCVKKTQAFYMRFMPTWGTFFACLLGLCLSVPLPLILLSLMRKMPVMEVMEDHEKRRQLWIWQIKQIIGWIIIISLHSFFAYWLIMFSNHFSAVVFEKWGNSAVQALIHRFLTAPILRGVACALLVIVAGHSPFTCCLPLLALFPHFIPVEELQKETSHPAKPPLELLSSDKCHTTGQDEHNTVNSCPNSPPASPVEIQSIKLLEWPLENQFNEDLDDSSRMRQLWTIQDEVESRETPLCLPLGASKALRRNPTQPACLPVGLEDDDSCQGVGRSSPADHDKQHSIEPRLERTPSPGILQNTRLLDASQEEQSAKGLPLSDESGSPVLDERALVAADWPALGTPSWAQSRFAGWLVDRKAQACSSFAPPCGDKLGGADCVVPGASINSLTVWPQGGLRATDMGLAGSPRAQYHGGRKATSMVGAGGPHAQDHASCMQSGMDTSEGMAVVPPAAILIGTCLQSQMEMGWSGVSGERPISCDSDWSSI